MPIPSHATLVTVIAFLSLTAASLGSLYLHARLPERLRDEKSHDIVRQVGGIFAMLGSLVLGLMVSAASSSYDDADDAIHGYAREIILLDRELRPLGPEAGEVRALLVKYLARVVGLADIDGPATPEQNHSAEASLSDMRGKIAALRPTDPDLVEMRDAAKASVGTLQRARLLVIDRAEGSVPPLLFVSMILWFSMVMATFGYRAPKNSIVVTSLVVTSALIAGAIYLILDMGTPYEGGIQVSGEPLVHALAEIKS